MHNVSKVWYLVTACLFVVFLAVPVLAETDGPFVYSSMPINVSDISEVSYDYKEGNMLYSFERYPNIAEKQYELLLAVALGDDYTFKSKEVYGNYTVFLMENVDGDRQYVLDPACDAPYGVTFFKSPYESMVKEIAPYACSGAVPPGELIMSYFDIMIVPGANETFARVAEIKSVYYSSGDFLEDYVFVKRFDTETFSYAAYRPPEWSVWQNLYHYGGGSNYDLYIHTNVSNTVVEGFLGKYLAAERAAPPQPATELSESSMIAIGAFLITPVLLAVVWFLSLVFLLIRDHARKDLLASKPFLRIKSHTALFVSITVIIMLYALLAAISVWLMLVFVGIPVIIALTRGKMGISLKRGDAPQLFRMIEDVTKRMGIRQPHLVMLTPDASIGVTGMFRRELHVGMGGLQKLSANELYAILVHEFGHFKGRDNIIGSSLMYFGAMLEKLVLIAHYLPTFYGLLIEIFMRLYAGFYKLATFMYSRQREYLADLWAARLAGSRHYASTLKKYSLEYSYFTLLAPSAIVNAAIKGARFKNIYTIHKKLVADAKPSDRKKFEKRIKSMDKDSWFSSHPSDKKRYAMIQGIKSEKSPHFRGSAMGTIKGIGKKQVELTKIYTDFIVKHIK